MKNLIKYGLTDRHISEANMYDNLILARVKSRYKGLYKIVSDEFECFAKVKGSFEYNVTELSMYPAVGDFVMVKYDSSSERAIIEHILTRKSCFERLSVSKKDQSQVVASNIDYAFICVSLNNNFSLNRIERYVSLTWDSGATPVIVLTKSDLCDNIEEKILEVEAVSSFCDVVAVSMHDDVSDKLSKYIIQGKTCAFIGSSGVGKSTIINKLLGNEIIETKKIDKNDKGRHTTTSREMYVLSTGGVLIDTPGMREIGIVSSDIEISFDDIYSLEQECKFTDCTHQDEPDCAVRSAIEDGIIDERRLENYIKIKNENGYDGLTSKEIETKKLERMFKDVGGMKNMRKFIKLNNKRNKNL